MVEHKLARPFPLYSSHRYVIIDGATGGPWSPHFFYRGVPGGPNLCVYFYNIASAFETQ